MCMNIIKGINRKLILIIKLMIFYFLNVCFLIIFWIDICEIFFIKKEFYVLFVFIVIVLIRIEGIDIMRYLRDLRNER